MKHLTRIGLFATASLLLYACGSNPAPTDTTAASDAQFDDAAVSAALADPTGEVSVSDEQLQAQTYSHKRDFEVYKTAHGYNERKIVYDWTLEKHVNKHEIYLKKNEKEVLKYKLVFNKNVASDTTMTGVKGRICVKNNTHSDHYAYIKDSVLLEKKHPWYYVVVSVNINGGHPVKLERNKENCFEYNIPLDKKYEGYHLLNQAKVVIPQKNKHGTYDYDRVEYAYAKFQVPKQTVIKVDEYAALTDYLECSDGLKCKLMKDDNDYNDDSKDNTVVSQDFGKFDKSGVIEYQVKVRRDNKHDHDKDDRHGQYVKNTAKLVEHDSQTVRTASQHVRVILKNKH